MLTVGANFKRCTVAVARFGQLREFQLNTFTYITACYAHHALTCLYVVYIYSGEQVHTYLSHSRDSACTLAESS
jgi:hypothetical protein